MDFVDKTLVYVSFCMASIFICCFSVFCVRCYQCASSQNKLEDTCGAYKKFDKDTHIAVDCNSDESHMPGSFCMKLTQQGPKGFICEQPWKTYALYRFLSPQFY